MHELACQTACALLFLLPLSPLYYLVAHVTLTISGTRRLRRRLFRRQPKKKFPSWLKLGDPELKGAAVNYLDMNIWNEGKRWHFKLYEKRVGLVEKGFKLNEYI